MLRQGDQPDVTLAHAVTLDDVRTAAARIAPVVHRTPVMTCRTLDARVEASVFIKCECFQRIGAFKIRGGYNALSQLAPDQRERGVLTYSSGNHAQATALAASLLDIPAVIVMPDNAPKIKLDATRAYLADAPAGSEVVVYEPCESVREELGGQIARDRGLTIVPPYDHPHIIAGQGTVALELLDEIQDLDLLLVPCGGGGLLSGSAIVAKAIGDGCRVVGVEPVAGDDATRSFHSGTLQTVSNPDTIADGARTPYLGNYTFPMILEHVDDMITVDDDALLDATAFFWQRMKLAVEPTGALALAGLFSLAKLGLGATRVGVINSGGNADVISVARLLERRA